MKYYFYLFFLVGMIFWLPSVAQGASEAYPIITSTGTTTLFYDDFPTITGSGASFNGRLYVALSPTATTSNISTSFWAVLSASAPQLSPSQTVGNACGIAGPTYVGLVYFTVTGPPVSSGVVSYFWRMYVDCNTDEAVPSDGSGDRTRISTVTPPNASVQATSTSFTIGATGYLSSDDVDTNFFGVSQSKVEIKWWNNAQQSRQLVGPGFIPYASEQVSVTGELEFPLAGDGYWNVSTTTSMLQYGKYYLSVRVFNDRFLFFDDDLVSTTTWFILSTSTAFDRLQGIAQEQISSLLSTASSTIDWDVCTPLSGEFSIVYCVADLMVPTQTEVSGFVSSMKSLLTKAPWGYFTRFIAIVSNNATSTLPVITLHLPAPFASSTLVYDTDTILTDTGVLLEGIVDPRYGKTLRDVFEGWVQFGIYFWVFMVIIGDLMDVRMGLGSKSRKET